MSDEIPTGPAYVYRATCARVVDGDTYEADIDLGFKVTIRIRVRLYGIDTPERGQPGYQEAKDFLANTLGAHLVRTYHDARTFERWVAEAFVFRAGGVVQSVSDLLLEAGLAVPFKP